jgi:DNA-binding response OmpR family regulator
MAAYRVLVVEDNREVGRMVTASIKSLGAEIDVLDVPSAEEALFISASLPFDLVVVDIRLAGMSGLEMVSRLQKRKPDTKIILVTGIEDADIRLKVSQANVAAYFFKPIDIGFFLEAVKRCLWTDHTGTGVKYDDTSLTTTRPANNENISSEPRMNVATPTVQHGFQPTLGERLTALKRQVRAISTILVNEAGQVQEDTGEVKEITTDPALLAALMGAFNATLKVNGVLGKSPSESIQYFTSARKRIYLAPVGPFFALLVVMKSNIEPDKLGILDRAIHLAVQDLQAILEKMQEEESLNSSNIEGGQNELPAEITIDQETQARVEDMFSHASKASDKEEADGFWETLGESSNLDGTYNKDILSYDQARDLGLAPDDDVKP